MEHGAVPVKEDLPDCSIAKVQNPKLQNLPCWACCGTPLTATSLLSYSYCYCYWPLCIGVFEYKSAADPPGGAIANAKSG